MLFVGCDGPGIEVVDLLVYVVDDGADALIAALGLEDANGLAPAFNCAALAIDGLEMLIVKNDGGGILGVVGSFGFGCLQAPIGNLLVFAEPIGMEGYGCLLYTSRCV